MGKSIRDGIFELTGKKATDAEIMKLMAIASAMNIKTDDPMIILIMVLEHYNGLYSAAPQLITTAVNKATNNAVRNAGSAVNTAVAGLIPGVQKAVSDAARNTMIKVRVGASMITIYAGIVILGLVFGIGILYGSGIQVAVNSNAISVQQFWQITGLSISSGLIIIGAMILSATWWSDEEKKIVAYSSAVIAVILTIVLIMDMLMLIK